jgi:methylmalonyl-CoA epimerase
MPIRLNHIGVAVKDLPEMKQLFSLLGLSVSHTEPVPDQGVTTHFLPIPKGETSVELLEVTDPVGTVAKFIAKRGPGIHHLSFTVDAGQLDSLSARLRTEGVRLIYPEARAGAHAMRINFIHPASAGGILIEIMEPSSGTA